MTCHVMSLVSSSIRHDSMRKLKQPVTTAEAAERGAFVAGGHGQPSISQFWDGEGAHLDFTNPAAITWCALSHCSTCVPVVASRVAYSLLHVHVTGLAYVEKCM